MAFWCCPEALGTKGDAEVLTPRAEKSWLFDKFASGAGGVLSAIVEYLCPETSFGPVGELWVSGFMRPGAQDSPGAPFTACETFFF